MRFWDALRSVAYSDKTVMRRSDWDPDDYVYSEMHAGRRRLMKHRHDKRAVLFLPNQKDIYSIRWEVDCGNLYE